MGLVVDIVLMALAILFIVATVLPEVRHDHWVIRACDFPRLQIATGGVLITILYLVNWDTTSWFEGLILLMLAGAVVHQARWILPFTPWATKQVVDAETEDADEALSVLVANVYIENRDYDAFLDLVRQADPDVILTLEPDDGWEEALRVLEGDYPHTVKEPLDNAYGIMLHSRYELIDATLRHIVEDDVPAIQAFVRLSSGRSVLFYGVHPRPPHPEEDTDTIERDAELLIVAHEVEEVLDSDPMPIVVAGDFNDPSWSYISTLFCQISGLLDPRRGRGPLNTFNALYPILRVPIDHVFHSAHFKVHGYTRLPAFGSDHFAILARLQYEDGAEHEQIAPKADELKRQHALEEIAKAHDLGKGMKQDNVAAR